MSRFDYVKYDETAVNQQNAAKDLCQQLELVINSFTARVGSARAAAIAHTKLEECYMWIGKAIRDQQIERNGSADLQEERKDG